MKNNIKQAVLFTIRDIENREYFKGVSPEPSQALIDYFISLGDDLTSWLNEHAQKRDVIKTSFGIPFSLSNCSHASNNAASIFFIVLLLYLIVYFIII